jgi:hypothetical protein
MEPTTEVREEMVLTDTGRLGPGTITLGWDAVRGQYGLGATLVVEGLMVANGYRPGDSVLLMADSSVWRLQKRNNAYLGSTTPVPTVIGFPRSPYPSIGPPPSDAFAGRVELRLRLDPSQVEELEDDRQGQEFEVQVDATVLYLPGPGVEVDAPWKAHPHVKWQERLTVTEEAWGKVLAQWDRGVGIPVVLPLAAITPGAIESEIVALLRSGWSKTEDGDYEGAIVAGRKALELLRPLAGEPGPKTIARNDQDASQRIRGVIDALFHFASSPVHASGGTRGWAPERAHAVAVLASSVAFAREIFSRAGTTG